MDNKEHTELCFFIQTAGSACPARGANIMTVSSIMRKQILAAFTQKDTSCFVGYAAGAVQVPARTASNYRLVMDSSFWISWLNLLTHTL